MNEGQIDPIYLNMENMTKLNERDYEELFNLLRLRTRTIKEIEEFSQKREMIIHWNERIKKLLLL